MTYIFFIVGCLFIGNVYAEQNPRSVAADPRVKVVNYDPSNVVVVHGRYGYQTQIVFAPNETIQNVSIGDSLAWQAIPVGNNLFIKPVVASSTNMTVLTNANSYSFQLNTDNNIRPTYKLQFVYPAGGFDQTGVANAVGNFDPSQLNWKYSFTGQRELAPIAAFDNGQFTYFKFRKNAVIPAIFIVDRKMKEALVNYHLQGEYVVINSVAPQFTFRNGNYVTSVYNDYLIGDWQKVK